MLDQKRAPESADDFDRLLVASPNDSSLWVQYMAFYLHTTEVDKARSVAQRALKTIVFRLVTLNLKHSMSRYFILGGSSCVIMNAHSSNRCVS